MFGFLKKKEPQYIVVNLNARIQPMHRAELFEEPLETVLSEQKLGEITGGGTLQAESGEIKNCDIELVVKQEPNKVAEIITPILEQLGIPKGSKIIIESTGIEIKVGNSEGLAIYLNGTDLEDHIYKECDSNYVYSELDRLTKGKGRVYSYWQGPNETAFYVYGNSFEEIKLLISELVNNYPLCQKCRIEQIA